MKNVVLMVDDNSEMRQVFSEALERLNLKVITFENVSRAQQYLLDNQNNSRVAAIVSDIMMAPTDGLEFLSFVKKNSSYADVDFFIFTGAEISVFKPFLKSFEIAGVISKPCKAEALRSVFCHLTTAVKAAA